MSELQNNPYEATMTGEIDDYKREREILFNETIDAKESFAKGVRDEFGEEILKELKQKSEENAKEKPKEPSKFKMFLKRMFDVL
jgi:hypothetical protein